MRTGTGSRRSILPSPPQRSQSNTKPPVPSQAGPIARSGTSSGSPPTEAGPLRDPRRPAPRARHPPLHLASPPAAVAVEPEAAGAGAGRAPREERHGQRKHPAGGRLGGVEQDLAAHGAGVYGAPQVAG